MLCTGALGYGEVPSDGIYTHSFQTAPTANKTPHKKSFALSNILP